MCSYRPLNFSRCCRSTPNVSIQKSDRNIPKQIWTICNQSFPHSC